MVGGTRIDPTARWRTLLAVLVFGVLLGACGGSGGDRGDVTPSKDAFADRVEARDGLAPDQAACFVDYLYRELSSASIRAGYQGGLAALPPTDWNSWGHSMLACALAEPDELPEAGTS